MLNTSRRYCIGWHGWDDDGDDVTNSLRQKIVDRVHRFIPGHTFCYLSIFLKSDRWFYVISLFGKQH